MLFMQFLYQLSLHLEKWRSSPETIHLLLLHWRNLHCWYDSSFLVLLTCNTLQSGFSIPKQKFLSWGLRLLVVMGKGLGGSIHFISMTLKITRYSSSMLRFLVCFVLCYSASYSWTLVIHGCGGEFAWEPFEGEHSGNIPWSWKVWSLS